MAALAFTAAAYAATVKGTNGPDSLAGGADNDVILAKKGNDAACGLGGNDRIKGHSGSDAGPNGNAACGGSSGLDGDAGNDSIDGDDGNDLLRGGDDALPTVVPPEPEPTDNDRLRGGRGADDLFGGAGNDGLHGHSGDDDLDGGPGTDFLKGHTGDDDIDAADGEPGDVVNARGDRRSQRDDIECDAGDVVKADRNDVVTGPCTVERPGSKSQGKNKN